MAFIACTIIENKINNLMRKRDVALKHKDYDRVWKLNMEIDNCVNRLTTWSYLG